MEFELELEWMMISFRASFNFFMNTPPDDNRTNVPILHILIVPLGGIKWNRLPENCCKVMTRFDILNVFYTKNSSFVGYLYLFNYYSTLTLE